jgi:hypothetical protein
MRGPSSGDVRVGYLDVPGIGYTLLKEKHNEKREKYDRDY